jgi:hypothetical protein
MSDEKTTGPARGIVRQGDVLLVPVERVPRYRREQEPGSERVLAEGEATGHAHTVRGRARTVRAAGHYMALSSADRYLVVEDETAVIVHPEHEPITVSRGVYRVVRQREYAPTPRRFAPGWHRVAD